MDEAFQILCAIYRKLNATINTTILHERLGPDVLGDEGKQWHLEHRLDHAVEVLQSTPLASRVHTRAPRLVVLPSTPQ